MILRRVIEHVKAQNWTAVALDFVIVVLGVFIGIQVANWNDASRDREREAVVLSQLKSEFQTAIEKTREEKALNADALAATLEVLRVIRDGAQPQDKASFLRTVRKSGIFGSAPIEPATLTEILSTGGLSELSSPSLITALIKYHEAMVAHEKLTDLLLQRVSTPHDGFHAVFYVNPDVLSDGTLFSDYDWGRIGDVREQEQIFFYAKNIIAQQLEELIELGDSVLAEIEKEQ